MPISIRSTLRTTAIHEALAAFLRIHQERGDEMNDAELAAARDQATDAIYLAFRRKKPQEVKP